MQRNVWIVQLDVRVERLVVPPAITQGEDEGEALMRARDALETALEMYIDTRQPLPMPSPAAGCQVVRPGALVCAKLAVYQAMQETGVRKVELARRLHWHLPQVDRLLNLRHASRLDQIEMALEALGRQLQVEVSLRNGA
ncbi:MAG: type II toxin-antitoxin system HicB family antitoxin [Magnetococcales bacterium]|nr:type II toxin-antitoxin system HicB family antitoxin [Magnetococcales bacterium]MBF0322163.1 type II toxin-antitoxin system HicB family antitoxin [Magnetococcales bacterium]